MYHIKSLCSCYDFTHCDVFYIPNWITTIKSEAQTHHLNDSFSSKWKKAASFLTGKRKQKVCAPVTASPHHFPQVGECRRRRRTGVAPKRSALG